MASPRAARTQCCPRCGGPMYPGYDDDHCCICCGERLYVDARGRRLMPYRLPGPSLPTPRKRGRPPANTRLRFVSRTQCS